jgi:uncharacterized membrane protein YjgN (DUF898 family)
MDNNSSYYRQLVKEYASTIDDISRLSEVIFGVIMVLTFTCAISIVGATHEEINTTLWAALGCNTAWGIVDGLMFLMSTLYERGTKLQLLKSVRNAISKSEANTIFRDNLSGIINEVMTDQQVDEICEQLKQLPEPPHRAFFTSQDMINAVIVFFLVFLSTFPIVLPFVFIDDAQKALRVSNLIGLIIMFIAGYFIGKKTGHHPVLLGFLFAILGAAIVGLTMFLGG